MGFAAGTSWRLEPTPGTTAIVLTQRAAEGPMPSALLLDVWSAVFGSPSSGG